MISVNLYGPKLDLLSSFGGEKSSISKSGGISIWSSPSFSSTFGGIDISYYLADSDSPDTITDVGEWNPVTFNSSGSA